MLVSEHITECFPLLKISNNPDVKMAFPVVMFCPYSCLSIIRGFWRSKNPGCGLKVCSNNPHLPSEWGPAHHLHVHMVGALGGKVWWHIFIKQAEVCWRMPTDVWCCTDRLAWDAPWALPNLHRCNALWTPKMTASGVDISTHNSISHLSWDEGYWACF